MDKYKPGDVFISSILGKIIIVEEDKKKLGLVMCEKCIYYEYCSSEDISKISNRREESGFCSVAMREDNKSILFKEYDTISESVLELVKEIDRSIMSIDEKDQYKLLLLNSIKNGK